MRAPDEGLDALDQLVAGVDVDSGVAIGQAAWISAWLRPQGLWRDGLGYCIGRAASRVMRHIPNIICLIRIVLIVPLLQAMLAGEQARILVLFCVAAVSDALDGYLAKRFRLDLANWGASSIRRRTNCCWCRCSSSRPGWTSRRGGWPRWRWRATW